MNFEYASNFTIFVLVVSIILSFTLRKLIQDIQSLKDGLMLDLSSFTRDLVEDHPTLEKYRKMALMYFRHEMFEQALSYFEHLIHERVFIREARYYKVICLMRLKRNSEASEVYEKLDLGQYSSEEVHLMRASFARQNPLIRWKDALLQILLTNVHFQYLPQGTGPNTREAEIERVITSLPTRYSQVVLEAEQDDIYIFTGHDQHLERKVRLHVAHPDSQPVRFFDYPKILARLDSRFFPEVYDLQQTGLIYYSQERFEGQSLFALFRKNRQEQRLEDTIRIWVSILGALRFLIINKVFLEQFDLSEIGLHARKNNLFFSGSLCDYSEGRAQAVEDTAREVLLINMQDALVDIEEPEAREAWIKGINSLKQGSLDDNYLVLEEMHSRMVSLKQADKGQLREQLTQIEKIHRASIHGLKGKYSIVRRYQGDPNKLLKTFFRISNLNDIREKILRLKAFCEELRVMTDRQSFGVCYDLLSLDLDKLIQRQESLYKKLNRPDPEVEREATQFLEQQYELFLRLSDQHAQFILEHEVDLILILEDFRSAYVERKINLEYSQNVKTCRVRVLDREDFYAQIMIVLENLANNAFEAGASDLRLSVFLESNSLRLEIRDNGPGIPEAIISDLGSVGTYTLEHGGTGLLASRDTCTAVGVGFEAMRLGDGAGSQINLQFSTYQV